MVQNIQIITLLANYVIYFYNIILVISVMSRIHVLRTEEVKTTKSDLSNVGLSLAIRSFSPIIFILKFLIHMR